MIGLPLPLLILVPVVFGLVALLLASLYYAIRQRVPYVPERFARIYRCFRCGHVYVDTRDIPMARCSRCGMMNEAVKR